MAVLLRALVLLNEPGDATSTAGSAIATALRDAGFEPTCQYVSSESDYRAALQTRPDVVIAHAHAAPLTAPAALAILRAEASGSPFLVIAASGDPTDAAAAGADAVAECLERGAWDSVPEDRIEYLGHSVACALRHHAHACSDAASHAATSGPVLENAQVGFYVINQHELYEAVNPAYGQILGYRPDELIGKPHALCVPEALRSGVATNLAELIRSQGSSQYEALLLTRDGRRRTTWTASVGFSGLDGQPRAANFVVDITHSKQAEETLRSTAAELQAVNRRLLALSRIGQVLQKHLHTADVGELVVTELRQLGFQAAILLREQDKLVLRHISFEPALLKAIEQRAGISILGSPVPADTSAFRDLASRQEAMLLDSAGLDSTIPDGAGPDREGSQVAEMLPFLVTLELAEGIRVPEFGRVIAAPLMSAEEMCGALIIWSQDLRQNDIPAITAFANQVAVAIDNARLYKEIEQRLRELAQLYSASNTVAGSLDAQAIANGLVVSLQGMLEYTCATVLAIDERTGQPATLIQRGEKPTALAATLWHDAAETGQPVYVNDTRQKWRRGAARSILCVPLNAAGQTVGVISIEAPRPDAYDEHKRNLLSALASSAAAAFENARLFHSVNSQSEQLRALATRLADAEEAERQRLARELHDSVGQNLTALGINLSILQAECAGLAPAAAQSRFRDSINLVQETTQQTRSLMTELRPPTLDDYGLTAALRWYGQQFSRRMGIAVNVDGQDPSPRLPPRTEMALFRIAQEALNNIAKHAHATRVNLSVRGVSGGPSSEPRGELRGELKDNIIRLLIEDNGVGFDTSQRARPDGSHGWGLVTMSERAEAVGARCEIDSHPGQGTRVTVELQA